MNSRLKDTKEDEGYEGYEGAGPGFALSCAIATVAWGLFAAIHYHRLGLTLAHYDARAHLVVARRVFDSLTPGWQQVGAVWLPLPHLLNAIPVQIDYLYRTGFSGVAISIASMAVAVWAIATLIARATGSRVGGATASALLMLNPDVLYLQSTPMTEPLLFGTTFLAVALVAEWCGPPSRPASPDRFGETAARESPARVQRVRAASTRAAGWACIAAILTRYEAFPIVAAAIGLAFVVLLRRGFSAGAAFRAVRGLALWPLWALAAFVVNSKVSVGAFFVSGGFFVAENPALGHPWTAWTQVWETLTLLTGPALPWIAAASAAALVVGGLLPPKGGSHGDASGGSHGDASGGSHGDPRGGSRGDAKGGSRGEQDANAGESDGVASAFRLRAKRSGGLAVASAEAVRRKAAKPEVLLPLALAACAALPLYAYCQGHPVRVRYAVPLVAAAAAITGTAIGLLPRRVQAAAGLAVVAIAVWQAPPFLDRAAVIVESQRDAANYEGRRTVTAYLEQHWDGSPIMMSMGSLGHYMHDLSRSGFDIRDFLHEGNGEIWKFAVMDPQPVVRWIAIEEKSEGGDALWWQGSHDATFLRGYERVAEGGGVALYRRY